MPLCYTKGKRKFNLKKHTHTHTNSQEWGGGGGPLNNPLRVGGGGGWGQDLH